jgi:PAS domain S-box-containing protein
MKEALFLKVRQMLTLPVFNDFSRKVFESDSKQTCEVRFTINGNPSIFAHIEGIKSENEQKCLLTAVDITGQKQAEAALKENLEDLRRMATVISDSNDAVILHDLEGKILAWNHGAKETYGFTEAEALGMNVRDIVAETDREAALTLIQRIKQGDIVKSFELRRVAKDGRILDVWLTITLLTDEKGKPVAIVTTERDITERKRTEEKLILFRNLLDNAIKFTEKGFIELGIKTTEDFVQFHVKDTSIGISGEFHDTIFERFRQVESANTRKYGGNGLGLAISKSLIQLLGGTIWMESEEGKGSAFYFTVPIGNN